MPILTFTKMAAAAAKETVNAPPRASILPKRPKVPDGPDPSITAPKTMNIEAIKAALRNVIIRVSTAVPKILLSAFAPWPKPRKRPLKR